MGSDGKYLITMGSDGTYLITMRSDAVFSAKARDRRGFRTTAYRTIVNPNNNPNSKPNGKPNTDLAVTLFTTPSISIDERNGINPITVATLSKASLTLALATALSKAVAIPTKSPHYPRPPETAGTTPAARVPVPERTRLP